METQTIQAPSHKALLEKRDKVIADSGTLPWYFGSGPVILLLPSGKLRMTLYFHAYYKEAAGKHLTKDSHPDDKDFAKKQKKAPE